MYTFLVTLSLFLGSLPLVRSHGFVKEVTVAGKTYPGWTPSVDAFAAPPPVRVTRRVGAGEGPVELAVPDINCGIGGDAGTAAIAAAPAGSQVKFQWSSWPEEHRGPVSILMTSCGSDCATFSANTAKWFKVEFDGYDAATNKWGADKLLAAGVSWTTTIPASLAAGKYLMRHEIVALHSTGKPQYYPVCLQLEVTGGGSGAPAASDLFTVQELYKGVEYPNIWIAPYTFKNPGPAPPSFVGGAPAPPAPSSTTPSSTTSSTSSSSAPTPPAASPAPADPLSSSSVSSPAPTGTPPPRHCGLSHRSSRLIKRGSF